MCTVTSPYLRRINLIPDPILLQKTTPYYLDIIQW